MSQPKIDLSVHFKLLAAAQAKSGLAKAEVNLNKAQNQVLLSIINFSLATLDMPTLKSVLCAVTVTVLKEVLSANAR